MNTFHDFHNIQDQLCEDIYGQLIYILEYKDNPYFRVDKTGIYDMLYYVKVEEHEYPIVGIKCLENSDEIIIRKQHLLSWNRNDVPISILVLSGEMRIYYKFSITNGTTSSGGVGIKKKQSMDCG